MNITLDANPSDAPGCLKLVADDGRDILIQTDWDWPAIAGVFGWSLNNVQHEGEDRCEHEGTDGTVKCTKCGMPVSLFIKSAREYIDNNDGAQAQSCSQQGQCQSDCQSLARNPDIVSQLDAIGLDQIRAALKEYGAWDAEALADDDANRIRVIWLAACDITENNR